MVEIFLWVLGIFFHGESILLSRFSEWHLIWLKFSGYLVGFGLICSFWLNFLVTWSALVSSGGGWSYPGTLCIWLKFLAVIILAKLSFNY